MTFQGILEKIEEPGVEYTEHTLENTDFVHKNARQLGLTLHHLFQCHNLSPSPTSLLRYKPRNTDVIITSVPKSGTTLLQQMAYQLAVLSGGAGPDDKTGEDYTDITEVAPWVDFGVETGILSYESFPRIFKTHSKVEEFLNVGHVAQKHIVVIRNPEEFPSSFLNFLFDDVISNVEIPGVASDEEHAFLCKNEKVRYYVYHHFVRTEVLGLPPQWEKMNQKLFTDEENGIDAVDYSFYNMHYAKRDWFKFTKGWLDLRAKEKNGDTPRILILFYEDIVQDLKNAVSTVAEFMGIEEENKGSLIETVVERCTKKYMAGNDRFKTHIEGRCFNHGALSKSNADSGEGYKKFNFNEIERHILNERFQTTFGVSCYNEFKTMVSKRVF